LGDEGIAFDEWGGDLNLVEFRFRSTPPSPKRQRAAAVQDAGARFQRSGLAENKFATRLAKMRTAP
jgi:hypothetical protein